MATKNSNDTVSRITPITSLPPGRRHIDEVRNWHQNNDAATHSIIQRQTAANRDRQEGN